MAVPELPLPPGWWRCTGCRDLRTWTRQPRLIITGESVRLLCRDCYRERQYWPAH